MGTPAPLAAMTSGNRYVMGWECPDTITCVLDYPKNYSVTYHGTMSSSIDDGGMEIRGTKATMRLDREQLAVYAEGGEVIGNKEAIKPQTLIKSRGDGTPAHLQNFLDCVRPVAKRRPQYPRRARSGTRRTLGNLSLKRQRRIK